MRKVKNVDSGYRLFGGGGCNRVTQMVVITGTLVWYTQKEISVTDKAYFCITYVKR